MESINFKELQITKFNLDSDTNYGIDKREGWSVSINGHVLSQFEPTAELAIEKATAEWKEMLADPTYLNP